jgi:hypothetical protein
MEGRDGELRGPRFDDAMKAVAEDDLAGLLAVLPPTEAIDVAAGLAPLDRELGRSAVRPDLLVRTEDVIVHGEYVKDRRTDLPLRMVEYRAQIRRRHPIERIVQFVLVLDRTIFVPDRYEDPDGLMSVAWAVVTTADLDAHRLLGRPATAALASLAPGSRADRARALTDAADLIAEPEPSRRRRLLAAAATLASIHLPLLIIEAALQEATMPVPMDELPLAHALKERYETQGLTKGRAEGRADVTRALLRRRFGDDARIDAVVAGLAGLSDDEALGRIMEAVHVEDLLP